MLAIGDHPNARLGLARRSLKNGNLNEAQKHLQKTLEHRPLQAEAIVLMASLLAIDGQAETAKQLMTSAPVVKGYHPDTKTERLFVRLLAHSEQTTSIEILKAVFLRKPDQTSRYLNLFFLYERNLDLLEPLLPPDPIVQFQYGAFLLENGERTAAEKAFMFATSRPVRSSYRNPEIFIHVAKYFINNSRFTEARIVANRGLVFFPGSKRLRIIIEDIEST